MGNPSLELDGQAFPRTSNKLPFQGGGSNVVSVRCFGVRVSVMFHFTFVHYTFSSVSVAEWPPFEK